MHPSLQAKSKLRDSTNSLRVFALDDELAHELGPILLDFENHQKCADAYASFHEPSNSEVLPK